MPPKRAVEAVKALKSAFFKSASLTVLSSGEKACRL